MTSVEHRELIEQTASGLAQLRRERPRVHCLTNFVAMRLTANLLLATGAVPSMTMDVDAMPDFIASSSSLLINLGMLDPWRRAAIPVAIDTAQTLEHPWVLDPVKVDRSSARQRFAQAVLDRKPAVLRCNADERPTLEVKPTTVTAVTGEVDHIVYADHQLAIAGGSPLMDRVTAMGCAGSGLIAAFLAVTPEPFIAASSALLVMKTAGAIAAEQANGPGSFEPAFLDAVYNLDQAGLERHARLA